MIPSKQRTFWILGLLTVCLAVPRCHVDHGLEPITSKIGGKIFYSGKAPSNTDEIRVFLVPQFPIKDITKIQYSEMIPFNRDTVDWGIYVNPARYDMVLALWKEKGRPWNLSDVIGLYGGASIGIPSFSSVNVPDKSTVLDTINITAYMDRVNKDASIEGTITFHGTWPPNTGMVGVGAFKGVPMAGNLFDYLNKLVAIDYNVPLFENAYTFRLRVNSTDVLNYISVLWIDQSLNLAALSEIGFYRDSSDTTKPGSVVMAPGTIQNIDINAYFDQLGVTP